MDGADGAHRSCALRPARCALTQIGAAAPCGGPGWDGEEGASYDAGAEGFFARGLRGLLTLVERVVAPETAR
jgi:hypothetical protein